MQLQHAESGQERSIDLGAQSRSDHRRVILLVGVARSGTTWLATILNTYNRVVYCHEPFYKLGCADVELLIKRLQKSKLDLEEKQVLINQLCKSHSSWCRPPFFPKDQVNYPCALQLAFWHFVRFTRCGESLFSRLFSPDSGGSYDLLIKEVDWSRYIENIVDSLNADIIFIIRHPCAVVASLRRGERLGLMPKHERHGWFRANQDVCLSLGYSSASVLAMDEYEFLTLHWLVQNLLAQRALERHPGATVVYCELCRHPLDVSESLFQFLGWSMGPETRQFIELSTGMRHSLLSDLRRKGNRYFGLYKDRNQGAGSWKTELTGREISKITSIASRLPGYRDYWRE